MLGDPTRTRRSDKKEEARSKKQQEEGTRRKKQEEEATEAIASVRKWTRQALRRRDLFSFDEVFKMMSVSTEKESSRDFQ